MNFSLVRVMLALQNHAITDSETDRPDNNIKAQLVVNIISHLNRTLGKEEEEQNTKLFWNRKNKYFYFFWKILQNWCLIFLWKFWRKKQKFSVLPCWKTTLKRKNEKKWNRWEGYTELLRKIRKFKRAFFNFGQIFWF